MIIKIDIDGVIRNISETMCELYNTVFKENITEEDITDYDVDISFPKVKECLGNSAAKFFFADNSHLIFRNSNPYKDAKEAIDRLMDQGHKVVIVTWQRTLQNKIDTLDFLERNNIKYDDICFTRDKWMIEGDWLIDDNPEFLKDEREKSKKIVIDMPYNKDDDFIHCIRTNTLKEAVDYILR